MAARQIDTAQHEAEADRFAHRITTEVSWDSQPGHQQAPACAALPGVPYDAHLSGRGRAYFEQRLGQSLPEIRLHTGADAHAAAAQAGARAFTLGADIAFAAGAYVPETTRGQSLLAHEVAHVAQQHAGRAPRGVQRRPDTPALTADELRDAEIAGALQWLPEEPGGVFLNEAGGLIALERRFPQSNALIVARLAKKLGQAKMDGLRKYDSEIMTIVRNAATILARIDALVAQLAKEQKDYASDYLRRLWPEYSLSYVDAAGLYIENGPVFLVLIGLLTGDPSAVVADVEREALRLQVEREAQVAAGRDLVGTTLATRDNLFWFDDTVTLESLTDPEYGDDSYDAALMRARIAGTATAVIQAKGRWYVYRLNEQYSLDDALASGFDKRTEIMTASAAPPATIVTTNGVVLHARERRYFVEENHGMQERLSADTAFLKQNRDELGMHEIFCLFRELLRDVVFANLERSHTQLVKELGKFFEGGMVTAFTTKREPAEQLQKDVAALRKHMLAVVRLAEAEGENLATEDRLRLETHLLAIGTIHARNPTATLFVANNRDAHSKQPPKESDFKDTLAGARWGDVLGKAVGELNTRLENIETVRDYLLRNHDAVLDFEPLHDVVLTNFTEAEQIYIKLTLRGHTLERIASAVKMVGLDLAIMVVGFAVGGPLGLAIRSAPVVTGAKGTAEAFEHVHVFEAMTQLDLTGEFVMATPDMAASARRWAWISLGLTVVDLAGFAHSANAMFRLRSVLANPDVAAILKFNRASLGDAARGLGMTEDALARELSKATGAARDALLVRMRAVTTPTISGGWAGFMGWAEDIPVEELRVMREALLARTDDVAAVGASVRRLGYAVDDDLVRIIKRYNFDSPGLAFAKENFDAWNRLASGRGTIGDIRYIIHEAEEVTRLQQVQKRTGFDFLAENWDKMTPVQRAKWRKQFMTENLFLATDMISDDVAILSGHYPTSHGYALEQEFAFMAEQANRLSNGRVRLSVVEAAAMDATFSGSNAREFMVRDGMPLALHPDIAKWQARAGEIVRLDPELRAAIGHQGLRDAIPTGRAVLSLRAAEIAAGSEPTLVEYLAIIRNAPAGF